jgi:hypothetical protein
MGQRIAVQQQERRSVASVPQMDSRAARHDFRPGEPFEHLLLLHSRAASNLSFLRKHSAR